MYETEANQRIESAEQLPVDAIRKFGELRNSIAARSVLPWSEHCTECVWPSCYRTCDLYSSREDGRCRRFVDGMVRIEVPDAPNRYVIKIRFKRWGKLWTPGNASLYSIDRADAMERRDRMVGQFLAGMMAPQSIRGWAVRTRYSYKKRRVQKCMAREPLPTSFILECYNPAATRIDLSFTIRSVNERSRIPFQKLLPVRAGFNRFRMSTEEIGSIVDLNYPFQLEIIPNEIKDGETLYFGLMDFIREVPKVEKVTKSVKCLIWDLDNTVWEGILVEDGVDSLRLKPFVVDLLRECDRRGIVHSIASKNYEEEARKALKRFGIDEYFLVPQIAWAPKSEGVRAIAESLNIGMDTLLFIDDSLFELEEVRAACPGVRVLQAEECRSLLMREDCQGAVTQESGRRRQLYREESVRKSAAIAFADDYSAFLRSCELRLHIQPMTAANLERVHELTQRTNQMNFSGNRYDRAVLSKILAASHFDTYVLSCDDRYGSYGIVGFSIVDNREPRVTDLMFSCRIQSKRVEHAFLAYLIRKYTADTNRPLWANYRKTGRNAASGKVFNDIGMEEVAVAEGVTSLVFPAGKRVPDDGIVKVTPKGVGEDTTRP